MNLKMKKSPQLLYFSFLFAWLSTTELKPQNLVPNPSFEQLSDCDLYYDHLNKATHWNAYHFTPDLFNACATNPYVSVPHNTFDSQTAAVGKAYAGILTFHRDFDHELIGAKLLQPLEKGSWYEVRFLASRGAEHARYATNNLGAQFTNDPASTYLSQQAHVRCEEVIRESDVWYEIRGTFQAEANYAYIVIGNFFSDESTEIQRTEGGAFEAAYYFIDEVSVIKTGRPSSPLTLEPTEPVSKAGDQLVRSTPQVSSPQLPSSQKDQKLRSITLGGRVLDAETKRPLAASVQFSIPNTKVKEVYETHYQDGTYFFPNLRVPENFDLHIRARNYYTITQHVRMGLWAEDALTYNFYLQPLRAGQSIEMKNISFEPGTAQLESSSLSELNRLIQVLKDNPTMVIEVDGYTDQSDEVEIAKLRAAKIRQYLEEVGKIDHNRIRINGIYQSTREGFAGDAADERYRIERLEFKILN